MSPFRHIPCAVFGEVLPADPDTGLVTLVLRGDRTLHLVGLSAAEGCRLFDGLGAVLFAGVGPTPPPAPGGSGRRPAGPRSPIEILLQALGLALFAATGVVAFVVCILAIAVMTCIALREPHA